MKQVFVNEPIEVNTSIMLSEKEAHHLFDVLRIQKKETIRVVNSDNQVFLAHPGNRPFLDIFSEIEVPAKSEHITLCAALIKSDKFEWMLQKACELGVTRIVPFESRYSVVHIDKQKEAKKLERWSQILLSACKQCNRNDLVELTPIQTVDSLHEFMSDCNLVAYEKEGGSNHISKFLSSNPKSITFCIGPEGGFDLSEIDLLMDDHFVSCSLGNRILRAETAAMYVLSAISYQRSLEESNEV
ncbi:MAG: 16S rRNA (uracil(1498)-N(3))-methyltransferase [Holdemanella sp.]|nr:16S rRNA (uracil(1498)-N(3))-methyltransferase [Holdemanella sp.]